jgi:hypothetical protein
MACASVSGLAQAGLTDRNWLGRRHGGRVSQFPHRRRLGVQQVTHSVPVLRTQREPGRKIIAHPEDRIHGPRRRHLTYWKRTPLRQLLVDKPAHDLVVDRELVLVHPHEHRAITPHGTKSPMGSEKATSRMRTYTGPPRRLGRD